MLLMLAHGWRLVAKFNPMCHTSNTWLFPTTSSYASKLLYLLTNDIMLNMRILEGHDGYDLRTWHNPFSVSQAIKDRGTLLLNLLDEK
jgi:hypothetical protein